MQRELFEVVDEQAKLERWSGDDYVLVISAIEHQPVCTLRLEPRYFRKRSEGRVPTDTVLARLTSQHRSSSASKSLH